MFWTTEDGFREGPEKCRKTHPRTSLPPRPQLQRQHLILHRHSMTWVGQTLHVAQDLSWGQRTAKHIDPPMLQSTGNVLPEGTWAKLGAPYCETDNCFLIVSPRGVNMCIFTFKSCVHACFLTLRSSRRLHQEPLDDKCIRLVSLLCRRLTNAWETTPRRTKFAPRQRRNLKRFLHNGDSSTSGKRKQVQHNETKITNKKNHKKNHSF